MSQDLLILMSGSPDSSTAPGRAVVRARISVLGAAHEPDRDHDDGDDGQGSDDGEEG